MWIAGWKPVESLVTQLLFFLNFIVKLFTFVFILTKLLVSFRNNVVIHIALLSFYLTFIGGFHRQLNVNTLAKLIAFIARGNHMGRFRDDLVYSLCRNP
jgi:hypothetical protein